MSLNFGRLENESEEELIYRICSHKDMIGSWNDVAEILNNLLGYEYTESKYRKQYTAFNKMLEANKDKFVTEKEYTDELEKQYADLKKERLKLQTLNVERNRIDRQDARRELYYEYIGDLVQALPFPNFQPLYRNDIAEREYVLVFSDVHDGATFKSLNNEYSFEIVEERFALVLSDMINFINEKGINKIHIVNAGDTIQGLIHTNDLRINDSTVVKSVVHASRTIAHFLNELSAYCKIEYYQVPTANHTQLRVLGAKSNELMDEDLEYVIGHYIQDLCICNDRIKVNLQENSAIPYVKLKTQNGKNIIAMHGHTIKDINNSIKDLNVMMHDFIDCLIIGHYHGGKEIITSENRVSDCEVIINPAFIGSDPYSDSVLKGSKSAVKVYGFSGYGHDETYKFVLN